VRAVVIAWVSVSDLSGPAKAVPTTRTELNLPDCRGKSRAITSKRVETDEACGARTERSRSMSPALTVLPSTLGSFPLTSTPLSALLTRSISRTAIEAAIEFGPCGEIRDAQIFAIGRKEVEEYRRDGIDLRDFEGTQVVTAAAP
jgi:hypothetical protein